MTEDAQAWVLASDYDLETAQVVLTGGRHLHVLFCCQQAVEKRLKALIIERSAQMPPRTHDLVRLAGVAALAVDAGQADFLARLTTFYVQTRYPEEMTPVAEQVRAEMAASTLRRTREFIGWLDQQMK